MALEPSAEKTYPEDLVPSNEYTNRKIINLHDPKVCFEEYLYYSSLSRKNEERLHKHEQDGAVSQFIPGLDLLAPKLKKSKGINTIGSSSSDDETKKENPSSFKEKSATYSPERENGVDTSSITDREWYHASRAARTATWAAVFYLITTDILGPFNTPYAFKQLGWGPAVSLYTIFGALAGYSGYQLWVMFRGLDSDRYPVKNYGDLAFRIYGQWFRYICNVIQSLQFFLNVGLIIISTGQSINEVSAPHGGPGLCFIACTAIAMAAGFVVGQIRTLARFGWLATVAVLLNVLTIFFTMGVAANSPPNYKAVLGTTPSLLPHGIKNPPPIQTSAGSPPGLAFTDNVTGLMQAVFAYGGATLFCEIMAEMKRPWDFWKGLMCADLLIYLLYLLFGCFMYGFQGQYAYNPAYQGISPYSWQTVGNVFQILTSIIAACLYGNIGIKVLYANVGRELLRFPLLEETKGKILWVIIVPFYWLAAWAVASSIPQFSNFTALVGASCILQFTYTFPPFMIIGYRTQKFAMLPEETFDPATGSVQRVDGGWSRWMRGLKKSVLLNSWDSIYSLGALTTAILGTYAAIYTMVIDYNGEGGNQVGWTCQSPTNG